MKFDKAFICSVKIVVYFFDLFGLTLLNYWIIFTTVFTSLSYLYRFVYPFITSFRAFCTAKKLYYLKCHLNGIYYTIYTFLSCLNITTTSKESGNYVGNDNCMGVVYVCLL